MSWRARLGDWVKRQRKRFGLWLCKHFGHKNKRYVSVDWASRGSMIAEADVCQRCGLITVVDVQEGITSLKYKQALKLIRNVKYGQLDNKPVQSWVRPLLMPTVDDVQRDDKSVRVITNMTFEHEPRVRITIGEMQSKVEGLTIDELLHKYEVATTIERTRLILVCREELKRRMSDKPVKVITDMSIEHVALMPDGSVQPRVRVNKVREPTQEECEAGFGALFGGEESTTGNLCKHWDGWYCTAPEVESETIHGCEGLLINCKNPKYKIGGEDE